MGMQDTYIPDSINNPEMEVFIETIQEAGIHEAPRLVIEGQILEIPSPVAKMFKRLLEDIVEGKPVTVITHDSKLTTQQAADQLGMSRPTLIKMLSKYSIPVEVIGRHRRIHFNDVMRLGEIIREDRFNALSAMRDEERALGLYDEFDQQVAEKIRQ